MDHKSDVIHIIFMSDYRWAIRHLLTSNCAELALQPLIQLNDWNDSTKIKVKYDTFLSYDLGKQGAEVNSTARAGTEITDKMYKQHSDSHNF